jgi:hypothetical protein
MVAFELSVGHFPNLAMCDSLVNELLYCAFFGAWSMLHVYSGLCLGHSVFRSPTPGGGTFQYPYFHITLAIP